MAGQLKVNGVTLATEESGTVTLEAPQIKDSSNNVILDQSGTNPVLKNVEVVNNSSMMFRNKIINGDMRISQRGDLTGVTSTTYGGPDRFQSILGTAGTWSLSKSTDAPSGSGFSNSFKFECTTANNSLSASSIFEFGQKIEGQNVQDLAYGTSSAKNVTLSFWVKSNLTGTYILEFFKQTAGKQISRSYTINAANTWEHKIVNIPGETSGALANDNTADFAVYWWLVAGSDFTSGTLNTSAWANNTNADRAVGQVNLASSTSNEFYITGVQLEVGTVATQFEHRPYGTELALCQRYYQYIDAQTTWLTGVAGGAVTTASSIFNVRIPLYVPLRSSPALNSINGVQIDADTYITSTNITPSVSGSSTTNNLSLNFTGLNASLLDNRVAHFQPTTNLTFNAEL